MPQPYRERRGSRYHSQEAGEEWQGRYKAATTAFHEKQISLDVFRAKLHGLGFSQKEIETEVNLHWPVHWSP